MKSSDARSSTPRRELIDSDINWDLIDAPAAAMTVAHYEDLLTEVLVDAQSYRVLTQEALHALAALTLRYRRLEDQYRALLTEYRALRKDQHVALLEEAS